LKLLLYVYGFIFLLALTADGKKKKPLALFTVLAILVVLMAANTHNPDYYVYKRWYEFDIIGTSEYLYFFISSLFNKIGFSFDIFRIIYSIICLLLINSTVRKIYGDSVFFWFLYFLYPFMMDVVQVRNFIAMSIFIYAIPFLLSKKRWDWLVFLGLMAAAIFFQKIFILFLPVTFLLEFKKSKIFKYIMVIAIIFVVMLTIFFSPGMQAVSNWLIENFAGYDFRVKVYMRSNFEFVKQLFFVFINFFLLFWSKKILDHRKKIEPKIFNRDLKTEIQYKYVELMYWINLFIFIYSPLIVINSGFSRLFRNMIPLNYLAAVCTISFIKPDRSNKNFNKIIYISAILGYALFNFGYRIYKDYLHSVLLPLFNHNYVFDFLLGSGG
jgi:hypothetical protein